MENKQLLSKNEMVVAQSVSEMMTHYALLVGKSSVEAAKPEVENYFDYIVEPQEYTDALYHNEILPTSNIVEEFLDNFYDKEKVYVILNSYLSDYSPLFDDVENWTREQFRDAYFTLMSFISGGDHTYDLYSFAKREMESEGVFCIPEFLNLIIKDAENEGLKEVYDEEYEKTEKEVEKLREQRNKNAKVNINENGNINITAPSIRIV